MIEGVDVSHHQPPDRCDWKAAAKAGLRFAWVKGSEGKNGPDAYVDPAAQEHAVAIRRTSIIPGMYHFARPDNRFRETNDGYTSGAYEGEHAAATAIDLGLAHLCLPVAIDLEKYTDKGTAVTEQRDDFVRGLVHMLMSELGRPPVIYAGAKFWDYQHSAGLAVELRELGFPLWLVSYSLAADPPRSIPGWPWSFWQWSGGGELAFADPWPGLPAPIDRNRYRGTNAEFSALVKT